jgi:UDP-N-acetylmuramoyl-tripeptide--D-alanyl-D-alanine ligase
MEGAVDHGGRESTEARPNPDVLLVLRDHASVTPGLSLHDVLLGAGGILRGSLPESTVFGRIELDPGNVRPGDLFLPVAGGDPDGHNFVALAALRGASAALVARAWADRVRERPLPLIVVDDPITALQRLASTRRRALTELRVVGVTGSVGKTSTKEVIAAVLGRHFNTHRSPGNRNNEIGLPLALLGIDCRVEVAVLEMGGAFALGEIRLLASIAAPSIGVVTNVAPVHLERMGSIERIAETKAELIEALPPDGVAVLNGDDPRVLSMTSRCRGRSVTCGVGAHNDVRMAAATSHGLDGWSFQIHAEGETCVVDIPFIGSHAPRLVLTAFAVGLAMGIELSEMASVALDRSLQVRMRLVRGPNEALIIDDTYNSSGLAVRSGLDLLADAGATRKVAVLGDMLELGALAESEHRGIGRRAGEILDVLITYGNLASLIADEAHVGALELGRTLRITQFRSDERDAVVEMMRTDLRGGDVVLVKGSRALRMEEFVAAVCSDECGSPETQPREP